MSFHYIDTDDELVQFCESVHSSPFIALDTEFIRERTYFPKLALIQIGTENTTACIDPISIDNLSSLHALLYDENTLKVVHAGRQDLEIFFHLYSKIPTPIFDTQIAATALGLGEQVSYAKLVNSLLSINLEKTQSRTNWLQRPLSKQQIEYALDDVRYLAQLYPLISDKLNKLQRADWLREEFLQLTSLDSYQVDTGKLWKKVKGSQKLRGVQLAILQQLAEWREKIAVEKDKPRRHIISDDMLVEISRLRPQSVTELYKIRSLQNKLSNQDAESLIQLIMNAISIPKSHWPMRPKVKPLTQTEDAIVDVLMAIVKVCANEIQVQPSILATRSTLEDIMRGNEDSPLLKGWRYKYAGSSIMDFLQDKTQIHMANDRLVFITK